MLRNVEPNWSDCVLVQRHVNPLKSEMCEHGGHVSNDVLGAVM